MPIRLDLYELFTEVIGGMIMIEMFIMFITHILKSIEFFATAGMPAIPLDKLPEAAAALAWQVAKLAEIYFAVI